MPITKSAKKSLRVSLRRRVFNERRKSALRRALKILRRAVEAKEKEKAQEILPEVYQAIDKAAKRGVIKKNTAARKKSRIARMINKV